MAAVFINFIAIDAGDYVKVCLILYLATLKNVFSIFIRDFVFFLISVVVTVIVKNHLKKPIISASYYVDYSVFIFAVFILTLVCIFFVAGDHFVVHFSVVGSFCRVHFITYLVNGDFTQAVNICSFPVKHF